MPAIRPEVSRPSTARRWIRAWWPAAAWAGAIFVASSTPGAAPAGPGWDKIGHAVAYAVLAVLAARGVGGGTLRDISVMRACLAAFVTLAYGVSDEWHQAFVPTRRPDLLDVAADAVGALAGAGAARAWSIYFHSRHEPCRTKTSW